jgi:hypothetical protein
MNQAYKLSLWIPKQYPENESGLAPRAARVMLGSNELLQAPRSFLAHFSVPLAEPLERAPTPERPWNPPGTTPICLK